MDLLAAWHYLQVKLNVTGDQRGASLVEYALLVALIAVVCIAAITLLGNNASTKFSAIGGSIGGS
jgi:pilus assembly protein Flp/PilA